MEEQSKKRRRIEEKDEEERGEEEGEKEVKEETVILEAVGPAPPPPKKKKKGLKFEKLFLSSLPCSELYELSYMHRDTVSHVAVTPTDFFLTASIDGHLKFWKKQPEGIIFVKHFRAHLAGIIDLGISHDGLYGVTVACDQTVKVFDVVGFDMINMFDIDFPPSSAAFVYSSGSMMVSLAIASAEGPNISIYDAKGGGAPHSTVSLHTSPVVQIKYIPSTNTAISIDRKGVIEYWRGNDASFPSDVVTFKYKMETDLFDLAKSKAYPMSLSVSPKGNLFAVFGDDRFIRVFNLATGKLFRKINENLEIYNKAQADKGENPYKLEAFDFGKRIAIEKELEKYWAQVRSGPKLLPIPGEEEDEMRMAMDVNLIASLPQLLFDESGNFLIYPTLVGIKVFNLVTNRVVRLIGKNENVERFLRMAIYQGKTQGSVAIPEELQAEAKNDPHLICTSHKRQRFYLFTRREPVDQYSIDGVGRDIFNERPPPEERAKIGQQPTNLLGTTATLHTTMGDITIKLFPRECPKTVQNFTTHAANGYYNTIIFHRVIKGFMIQTGDPLGDGTGGSSIWGEDFEDEFHRDLRHDRPFTVSMANAGPHTNGSQFFITTVPTPRLDNKHTVFGRVTSGMERVLAIEKVATDKNDKPLSDIKIISITLSKPDNV